MEVRVKNAQDPVEPDDGLRVAIEPDLLGAPPPVSVGMRLPEVGPSRSLAAWFRANPAGWLEFRIQYQDELRGNPHVRRLTEASESSTLTILTSSRDPKRSAAEVLRALLRGR